MTVPDESRFRLRLAEGFLEEARLDIESGRWRACVDHSQLAVENTAKAALGLVGPIGRTHDAGAMLGRALEQRRFAPQFVPLVEKLAENARLLGSDAHIHSSYGDESAWQTPWEIFDQGDANRALERAQDSLRLLRQLIESA